MNRAQRRQGQREGWVCEHGYPKKTDGRGYPACPHRCGFDPVTGGMVTRAELHAYEPGGRN